MPKIPSFRQIQTDPSIQARNVVQMRGGEAVGNALSGVGRALTGAANTYENVQEADAKLQATKARNQLFIAKTELDGDKYEGIDYKEIGTTYETRFKTARDAAASSLDNPRAAKYFELEADKMAATGMAAAREKAFKRRVEVESAAINSQLEELRKAGLEGDMLGAAESAQAIVDAGVENGLYGADDAQAQMSKWRDSLALGKLEMMEPEDRVEALKEPWAQELDPDVRAKVTRSAEKASLATRAGKNAEGYVREGLSREEALAKADGITDDRERLETKDRLNTDYDREDRNKTLRRTGVYEKYAAEIGKPFTVTEEVPHLLGTEVVEREDKFGYDQIPAEELDAMTSTQRQNLRKISDQRYNPRTQSDVDVLVDLARAASVKDWDVYNAILMDSSNMLTESDRLKYTVAGIEGDIPEAAKMGVTIVQAVDGQMSRAKINNKDTKRKLILEVGEWVVRNTVNGKAPSDTERQKFIGNMLLEREVDWGIDKPLIDVDDPVERLALIKESDAETINRLNKRFKEKANRFPEPDELLDIYLRYTDGS